LFEVVVSMRRRGRTIVVKDIGLRGVAEAGASGLLTSILLNALEGI